MARVHRSACLRVSPSSRARTTAWSSGGRPRSPTCSARHSSPRPCSRTRCGVQQGHSLFHQFGGIHHINANGKAATALQANTTFPDGSVFVLDVLTAQPDANAILERARRLRAVMEKDGKRFAKTGGWGYAKQKVIVDYQEGPLLTLRREDPPAGQRLPRVERRGWWMTFPRPLPPRVLLVAIVVRSPRIVWCRWCPW